MTFWLPYLLLTLVLGLLSLIVPAVSYDYNDNCANIRKSSYAGKKVFWTFALIIILLIIFCSFRQIDGPTFDEVVYRRRFAEYSGLSFIEALTSIKGEYINSILVWVSTILFNSDQGLFVVFGGLTALFLILGLRKYSRNFSFGIVLLMLIGVISTSFNIVQQSLASAIFLYFSNFIYEKKVFKFILLVLVCSQIHFTAIIFFVFYFFVKKDNASVQLWILFFGIVFVFLYFNLLTVVQYFSMLDKYLNLSRGSKGVNIITIIINCIPAILVMIYSHQQRQEDKITILAANVCLLHSAIYIASIFEVFIARFAIYTAPFCVVFLSREGVVFGNSRFQKIIKCALILLYIVEIIIRTNNHTFSLNFSI